MDSDSDEEAYQKSHQKDHSGRDPFFRESVEEKDYITSSHDNTPNLIRPILLEDCLVGICFWAWAFTLLLQLLLFQES